MILLSLGITGILSWFLRIVDFSLFLKLNPFLLPITRLTLYQLLTLMYSHPMQHILKYTFISLILLLSSAFTYGQQKRVQGPWLGFEAGSLVRKYFEPGLDAYTFSLDYEVDLKYY